MSKKYKVEGMSCGGCAASVTKALEKIGLDAEVSLSSHTVTVKGEADDGAVKRAIEAAGYDFVGPV